MAKSAAVEVPGRSALREPQLSVSGGGRARWGTPRLDAPARTNHSHDHYASRIHETFGLGCQGARVRDTPDIHRLPPSEIITCPVAQEHTEGRTRRRDTNSNRSGSSGAQCLAGDKVTVKFEEAWYRGTILQTTPKGDSQTLVVLYDGQDGAEEVLPYPDPDGDVFVDGIDTLPPGADQNIRNLPGGKVQQPEAGFEVAAPLSEYDQDRQANIQRNMAFMASLNMSDTKDQMAAAGMIPIPNKVLPPKKRKADDNDREWTESAEDKRQRLADGAEHEIPSQQRLVQPTPQTPTPQPLHQYLPGQPVYVKPTPKRNSTLSDQTLNQLELQAGGNRVDLKPISTFAAIAGLRVQELGELMLHFPLDHIKRVYNPGGGVIRRGAELKRCLGVVDVVHDNTDELAQQQAEQHARMHAEQMAQDAAQLQAAHEAAALHAQQLAHATEAAMPLSMPSASQPMDLHVIANGYLPLGSMYLAEMTAGMVASLGSQYPPGTLVPASEFDAHPTWGKVGAVSPGYMPQAVAAALAMSHGADPSAIHPHVLMSAEQMGSMVQNVMTEAEAASHAAMTAAEQSMAEVVQQVPQAAIV